MADEKTAGNTSPEESIQQAMEHARAINEQILQTAAKAGREMLDGYVRWLEQVAEQQRKIASGSPVSQVDWLAAVPGRARRGRRVIVPAILRGSRRHERRDRPPSSPCQPSGGHIDLDPAEALVRQLSPLDAAFV
jgi:hypothetical protein